MTDRTKIRIDTRQLDSLPSDLHRAAQNGLRAAVERGVEVLHDEVAPISEKLEQGVSSELSLASSPMEGKLIVTGIRPAQPAQAAVVHRTSGKVKEISLRPQPAFDFAKVVAEGRRAISPKSAAVLLIPVNNVTLSANGKGESYLQVGLQKFILRRSARAVAPNPYDQRAAARIENEVVDIIGPIIEQELARSQTGGRK